MKRREFIGLVGGAAAWPLAARAQQRMLPVIGVLSSTTAAVFASRHAAFMQGLKETGFVEGQNVAIEWRWADDQYDRLPDLAADLVRRRVSLIAALGNNLTALAVKSATTTIPIVFTNGADPVRIGLVASLNRPGGNITGVTTQAADSIRLQLLHDLVPNAKVFGFLTNPDSAGATSSGGYTQVELVENTVRNWGVTLQVAYARTIGDFEAAFASLATKRIDALAVSADALFNSGRERVVALAAQHAMPAVYFGREFVIAGGLMSYGSSLIDTNRQAGLYVGRILKGEKPADLPVLLPTKFEFVINLRTAKTLALTINPGLLAIVDEAIE
jgi:putative ABC transport system substrate-binding protein